MEYDITSMEISQAMTKAMETVIPGAHYVIIAVDPDKGGCQQIANVPPEGQSYYLQQSLEMMKRQDPEEIPNLGAH